MTDDIDAQRLGNQSSDDKLIKYLTDVSAQIRLEIFESAIRVNKGHVPPAFSWVDLGVSLFLSGKTTISTDLRKGDMFLLSKGHGCLTYYSLLCRIGAFTQEDLAQYLKPDHFLAGHPDPIIPGVPIVSGSLGHGLGIGAGVALGKKIRKDRDKVYVLLGDGELQEGSIWEAVIFAANQSLGNLIGIVDYNKFEATISVRDIGIRENIFEAIKQIGWEIVRIDGHSFIQILNVLEYVNRRIETKPLLIVADTIKGKGVSFMEASKDWHHSLPKGDSIKLAIDQLKGHII